MGKQEFTLEVQGKRDRLHTASLAVILRNMDNLLSEIERSARRGVAGKMRWDIDSISKQSPVTMTASCEISDDDDIDVDVPDTLIRGWRTLELTGQMPEHFNEHVIASSLRLYKELRNGVESLRVSTRSEGSYELSLKMAHNAELLVAVDQDYYEWTTIDGTLELIDVHGDDPRFRIYNESNTRGVNCFFHADLLPSVRADMSDSKDDPTRISVYGKARVSSRDITRDIRVESYEVLREVDRSERGVDITGDVDSVEHVQRVRYGEA